MINIGMYELLKRQATVALALVPGAGGEQAAASGELGRAVAGGGSLAGQLLERHDQASSVSSSSTRSM
jgi:hypothetical protein